MQTAAVHLLDILVIFPAFFMTSGNVIVRSVPTYQPAVLPRLFERTFVHHRLKVVTTSLEFDRGGGAHRLRPEQFAACTVGQAGGGRSHCEPFAHQQ